jgi:hypothetical protein
LIVKEPAGTSGIPGTHSEASPNAVHDSGRLREFVLHFFYLFGGFSPRESVGRSGEEAEIRAGAGSAKSGAGFPSAVSLKRRYMPFLHVRHFHATVLSGRATPKSPAITDI